MIIITFFLSIFFNLPLHKEEKIWRGKTFFYEIYCKQRNGFYTVEMRGPKYYSIEIMPTLGEDALNKTDTIAKNTYQSIIRDKKGGLKFSDKRWVNCKLKENVVTEDVKRKRLSLFYYFLYLKISDTVGVDKIPKFEDTKGDFQYYDETGDIAKIIHKYTGK
jgi:hypothetical protein